MRMSNHLVGFDVDETPRHASSAWAKGVQSKPTLRLRKISSAFDLILVVTEASDERFDVIDELDFEMKMRIVPQQGKSIF